MKKILVLLIALNVAACGQIAKTIGIQNPIDNNKLSVLISTWGTADSFVIAYRGLPRCTIKNTPSITNWCYKRSVLVQAQIYDKQASDAINKAVAWQRNNPTLDASSYIEAAQNALDIFVNYNATHGISQ